VDSRIYCVRSHKPTLTFTGTFKCEATLKSFLKSLKVTDKDGDSVREHMSSKEGIETQQDTEH